MDRRYLMRRNLGAGTKLYAGYPTAPTSSLLASVDGPDNWYRPATDAEWTALAASDATLSVPTRYYLVQDAAGGLTEKNGGTGFSTNGTRVYQQAVTGWTALAIGQAGTGSDGWYHNTAVGSNPASTSVAWLWYGSYTKPGGNRFLCTAGLDTSVRMDLNGKLAIVHGGGVSAGTSADHSDLTVVRAYLFIVNRTAQTTVLYTSLEQRNGPAWGTGIADQPKGLYPTGTQAAASRILYIAQFQGAAAEALTKGSLNTLMRGTLPY